MFFVVFYHRGGGVFGLLGWGWLSLGLVGEEGLLKANMREGLKANSPPQKLKSRWLYGAVPSS